MDNVVNSFDHSDLQCSELCTNHCFCFEEFVVNSGQDLQEWESHAHNTKIHVYLKTIILKSPLTVCTAFRDYKCIQCLVLGIL